MSRLHEHIDLARQFEPETRPVEESGQQLVEDRTAQVSVDVMKHLAESKPAEPEPVQLKAVPVPN